ncbi:MAG: type II secretion system F family protein [Pirellulaceae bacterium]
MAHFHFQAVDHTGREVAGTLEAETPEQARELLHARGLQPRGVQPAPSASSEKSSCMTPLSQGEAKLGAAYLAELSSAGLPLGAGLRAAAAECGSRRLSARLTALADRADAGVGLDELLAGADRSPQLAALVRSSSLSRTPGETIVLLQSQLETSGKTRRAIRLALLYPGVIVALTLLLCMFFAVVVVNPLSEIMAKSILDDDFSRRIPHSTAMLLWMSHTGVWALTGTLAATAAIAGAGRRWLDRATWDRLVANVPLVGPAFLLSGVAEVTSLVATLLKASQTLPDVLRAAAELATDRYVAGLCLELAEQCELGRPLSQCIDEAGRLPRSIVPFLAWGESSGALAEAFETVSDLMRRRAQLRVAWLRVMAPTLAFTFVAFVVLMLYSGILEVIVGQMYWFW